MNWKAHKDEIRDIMPEKTRELDIIIELVARRKELGLTQKDLEKKTGIKQPAIARIETEGVVPGIDTLNKIAEALGMEIKLETKI